MFAALGVCLALTPNAKADFDGDYSFSNAPDVNNMYGNWTLFNTGQVCNFSGCVPGNPSGTYGYPYTPDNGSSLILNGSNSGTDIGGITELYISAAASGVVQFNWSYSSLFDLSQFASISSPTGCGVNYAGPCNEAGYYTDIGGNITQYQLADAQTQGSSLTPVTFAVTAGEIFGFYVNTDDNTGAPEIAFTITSFNAPDPSSVSEPNSGITLIVLLGALIVAQRLTSCRTRSKETAA